MRASPQMFQKYSSLDIRYFSMPQVTPPVSPPSSGPAAGLIMLPLFLPYRGLRTFSAIQQTTLSRGQPWSPSTSNLNTCSLPLLLKLPPTLAAILYKRASLHGSAPSRQRASPIAVTLLWLYLFFFSPPSDQLRRATPRPPKNPSSSRFFSQLVPSPNSHQH